MRMTWPRRRNTKNDETAVAQAEVSEPAEVVEQAGAPESAANESATAPALHATALHGASVAVASGEAADSALPAAPALQVDASRRQRSTGRWVAWLMAMVAVGVGLGLVIVMVLKFVDGPVETHPANSAAKMLTTPTPSANVNELSGISMSFQYPGVFDQLTQLKNDAHSVEQYNISSRSSYQRLIAASVRTLPSNVLDDDSNYRIRRLNPQEYSLKNETLQGEKVAIMSKTDKTEVTLFWTHKGQILSVAITSNNPKDDIVGYMNVIKASARWKQ